MSDSESTPARVRWARLRFSIVGSLLAAPPEQGMLRGLLEGLAAQSWKHPSTGEAVKFAMSTIERWYYTALNAKEPIDALARKVPSHAGTFPSMPAALLAKLLEQYRQHPTWSYQLHRDNLAALVKGDPALGPMPSYGTICRVMKARGLVRQKKRKKRHRDAQDSNFEIREQRSFETEFVHGLWHTDFHQGSRRVLLPTAEWATAFALAFLDDRCRLCAHLQWYLNEDTESFVHGLIQAILKRGLFRALLSDNGAPMTADETQQGLARNSILHYTTLTQTPEQNGKQESFWGQIEGRLLPMLEGHKELTLPLLNEATQAWVELEYNRAHHSELGESPLECFLREKNVGRPSPTIEQLRRDFRVEQRRTQRRSDGTISVEGVRFEIPSRYRTLLKPTVRFARWDRSSIDLVDPRSGAHLATLLPLDKRANADRRRRVINPIGPHEEPAREPAGIAPLLRQLMAEYAATGLPPAYLVGPESLADEGEENE